MKILILGGTGFIGSNLAIKMKKNGNYVRIADIKDSSYVRINEICDDFLKGDLRDPNFVEECFNLSGEHFDEVYQLAADMGGAGYIFTGENDANVMHNSSLINLNVCQQSLLSGSKKIFYSSSACIYSEHNQMDPNNPNCEESSAYPANPDSEYGWEKLFSERMYLAFHRNYGLNVRIARFHNIFGPLGTWSGGKEKAPAAMCRKAIESSDNSTIEVWGDGKQTRSFLYIDDCLLAIEKFMESEFIGPVNIGSEEMITINQLAEIAISLSNKNILIENITGDTFLKKYGFKCPIGVNGRKSDNKLFSEKVGWTVISNLREGMSKTYKWIESQVLEKFSEQ